MELLEAIRTFHRQALHAAELEFAHPITGEMLQFRSAACPADMLHLIECLVRDRTVDDEEVAARSRVGRR